MISCLLCHSVSTVPFYIHKSYHFHSCTQCGTVFRDPATFISSEAEKARYLTHNNDVEDKRYQEFVSPITSSVMRLNSRESLGLDYGAGTGPVIAKILEEEGYRINLYDPFFHPDKTALAHTYDFIVCCEVIEHFHNPIDEFRILKQLLNPSGKLYCMTDLLVEKKDFENWYYKDDPTHVIFYSEENLHWIRRDIQFDNVVIDGRLIIFQL